MVIVIAIGAMIAMIHSIHQYLHKWASQKWWPLYVATWLYFGHLFLVTLADKPNFALYPYYLVNFGVHEMAHVVFSSFNDIITASAGSISEIVLVVLFIVAGLTTRSFFASAMCMVWLMFSFYEAGTYMTDANVMELDLVSIASATGVAPPSETIHDWNFVFGELGWLGAAEAIGATMKIIGTIIGIIGLSIGVYLISLMIIPFKEAESDEGEVEEQGLYPVVKKKASTPKETKLPKKTTHPDHHYVSSSEQLAIDAVHQKREQD